MLTLLVYRRDVRTSNLCDKKWCTSRRYEKPQHYPHTTASAIAYRFESVWLKEWLKTATFAPIERAKTFETQTASARKIRWGRRKNSLTILATSG